jgi:hypothetical protein
MEAKAEEIEGNNHHKKEKHRERERERRKNVHYLESPWMQMQGNRENPWSRALEAGQNRAVLKDFLLRKKCSVSPSSSFFFLPSSSSSYFMGFAKLCSIKYFPCPKCLKMQRAFSWLLLAWSLSSFRVGCRAFMKEFII